MLTVKPIQDKEEQSELCRICGTEFHNNSLAYRADDSSFIGICQFYLDGVNAYIENLSYAPGISDTEAMIIMLRTTMNFIFRCDIENCYLTDKSLDGEILKMSAFTNDADGNLYINLKNFYSSPCHYNKENN